MRNRKNAFTLAGAKALEGLEDRVLFSTYVVTGGGDGAGQVSQVAADIYEATTLRGAVAAANAKSDADVIVVKSTFKGTITLGASAGELAITNPATIQGAGADRQAVSGGGATRVFSVAPGVTAEIDGLTVENGRAGTNAPGGAGIRNLGTLTLRGVTVRDNVVVTNDGGGVFNAGTLKVADSTFSGNTAAGSGGGLFNKGIATIVNSTFAGNSASYGGAITNLDGGKLLLSDSTVSGNHATVSGGGISATLENAGSASGTRLNNSIVAGNTFNPAVPGALGPDLFGFFDSASAHNLIGSLGFAKGLDASKNLLGSIENKTPAIDAGDNALIPAGVVKDQRGLPRVGNGKVDIGAVETQVTPAPKPGDGNGQGPKNNGNNGNNGNHGQKQKKEKKDKKDKKK
jgi:predicted outer membrane repeat protein